jgi:pimeloyl-ACP methyl ester carboxylesterase
MHQEIQYCTASDGVRLAYSKIGKGTPIVRTPHWLAHLEYDLKGPIYRHQILGLAHRHSLLRYDGRGLGLSQREVKEICFDRLVEDLETIVDHAGLEQFILVGLSQGGAAAIAYASRHPDRLTHLIIYGAFARGLLHRENLEKARQTLELSRVLVREGWGSDQDSYREFFTSQFIPDGTMEQHRWLNQIQRITAAPEVAERIMCLSADINVVKLLPRCACLPSFCILAVICACHSALAKKLPQAFRMRSLFLWKAETTLSLPTSLPIGSCSMPFPHLSVIAQSGGHCPGLPR